MKKITKVNWAKTKEKYREEKVRLEVDVKNVSSSLETALKNNQITYIKKGDALHLTYNFDIEYYSGIATRLRLILEIMRHADYIKGDLVPLNHKICLIKDLIKQFNLYAKSKRK